MGLLRSTTGAPGLGGFSRVWLVIVCAILCAGCGARRAYNRGVEHMGRGQYDAAVANLTQAVAAKPDNIQYREALAKAKTSGAKWRLSQARAGIAATDLGEAVEHLEAARRYDPTLTACDGLLAEVRRKIGRAESYRTEALSLGEAGRWDDAVARIREALAVYRSLPDGEKDLDRLCERAAARHLDIARKHLEADDWDAAEASARRAMDYGADRAAAKVMKTVTDRRMADALIKDAAARERVGQFADALEKLQSAEALHPQRADLPEKIARVSRHLCGQWIAEAKGFSRAGSHIEAMKLLSKCEALLPGYGDISSLIDAERRALAAMHTRLGEAKARQLAAGSALVHFVAALGYTADDPGASTGLQQSLDTLRRKTQYRMAIVGFQGSHPYRQIATRLEAATLQQLLRAKPPNVLIMDRVDIAKVLDEQDLSLSDLVDPRFRVASGRLQGVDGMLVGEVVSCDVLRDRTSRTETSRYTSGMILTPNRAHERARQRVRDAETRLRKCRQRLAAAEASARASAEVAAAGAKRPVARLVGGATNPKVARARREARDAAGVVASARRNLADTPANLRVPNVLTHRYPVHTITATSTCEASLKILDSMTGGVIAAEPISGSYSSSDRYVKGDPARNVPEDPIDLPNDAYMREKAVVAALGNLDEAVGRVVGRHGARFAVMASRAARGNRMDEAVENAMCYLLSYPVGGGQTAAMVEIVARALEDEAEFLQMDDLLRRHCRVLLTAGELPARLRESGDGLMIVAFRDRRLSRRFRTPCSLSAVDGMPIRSKSQLQAVLSAYGAGDEVALSLRMANGDVRSASVALTEKR